MQIIERNLSDLIDKEYKEYAIYSLESRSCPNYCDGFKSTSRKLIYSMIKQFKGKKVKVSELAASIASVANYHHGSISAEGAVVTLSADWNNNVPVFQGHGNFGSRLINDAAAARYIFAELNQDFYKYFTDFSVTDKHYDLDNPEPQNYLPIIPWILVNGIEGIAVGFANKYLPHKPEDIARHCLKEINGELLEDDYIPVSFPHFKGEIIQDTHDKVTTRGVINKLEKKNRWIITEVPWGYDREKYFTLLDKMVEQNKIQDFEDLCNAEGFKFIIKLDNQQNDICEKDPIDYFKLEKSFTENYTALDENGKLIIFENKNQIIKKFVSYRINKVKQRIDQDILDITNNITFLEAKLEFIKEVIDKQIDFINTKKSDLLKYCISKYNINNESADKIIGTPIYQMTADNVKDLMLKINQLNKDKKILLKSDPKKVYIDMLNSILK